jgi:hypothetical protein
MNPYEPVVRNHDGQVRIARDRRGELIAVHEKAAVAAKVMTCRRGKPNAAGTLRWHASVHGAAGRPEQPVGWRRLEDSVHPAREMAGVRGETGVLFSTAGNGHDGVTRHVARRNSVRASNMSRRGRRANMHTHFGDSVATSPCAKTALTNACAVDTMDRSMWK